MPGRRSRSHQNGIDPSVTQNVHALLVAGGNPLEVVDGGRRSGQADLRGSVQRFIAGESRSREFVARRPVSARLVGENGSDLKTISKRVMWFRSALLPGCVLT